MDSPKQLEIEGEETDVSQSKHGGCINQSVFGKLGSGCLEKGLIFGKLNLGPWYTDDLVSKNNVGMEGFYGICLISSLREKTTFGKVLAIAESIMPGIPDEMFLTEAEARNELFRVIKINWKDIISDPHLANYFGGLNDKDYFEFFLNKGSLNIRSDLTSNAAMKLLKIIIQETDDFKKQKWRSWIVLVMVSCAKRGQVNPEWITKFRAQTYPNLSAKIPDFDEATVSLMYKALNMFVTEETAEGIFKRWADLISESFLLNEMLLQTEGTGLLPLETTIRAIRDFVDFPWMRVQKLYPKEFLNFLTAVKTVKGNRYYGFKRDPNPANGSLFCSLAWVAKELEVNINKDVALNDCKEWQRDTKGINFDIIRQMTKDYARLRFSGETSEPLDQKEQYFAASLVRVIECYGPLK